MLLGLTTSVLYLRLHLYLSIHESEDTLLGKVEVKMAERLSQPLDKSNFFKFGKLPLYHTTSIIVSFGGLFNTYVTFLYKAPLDTKFLCTKVGYRHYWTCIGYEFLSTRHRRNDSYPAWSYRVLYPSAICDRLFFCRRSRRRARSTTRNDHRLLHLRPWFRNRSGLHPCCYVHCRTHYHRNW